jgi:hypothetical protein
MSKEKDGKKKQDKTAPAKSLKEKRAEKAAKKEAKSNQ